jgi:hypothetical protein
MARQGDAGSLMGFPVDASLCLTKRKFVSLEVGLLSSVQQWMGLFGTAIL